jgi:hypothetical protein
MPTVTQSALVVSARFAHSAWSAGGRIENAEGFIRLTPWVVETL